MAALDFMVFVCVSVLLFEGGFSVERIHVFYRSGQMAIIPCGRTPPSTCSKVGWFDDNGPPIEFQEGNGQSPPTDVRFHLSSNCSLVINNVSGEDASRYLCRPDQQRNDQDTFLYLNILTVSESPPDADPNRDGSITLQCSLNRTRSFRCPENSLRWENEERSELTGTRSSIRQRNCVSTITVKRSSGHNRRYTCLFVDENQVRISADHTLVFITERKDGQTENSSTDPVFFIRLIIVCVGLTGLSLTACVLPRWMNRKRNTTQISQNEVVMSHRVAEASAASTDPDVTYENQQNT
ncbi:uncharacterized protein LOC115415374 [Sphaeramia orbicularis]|uniref:uncharacterized protein LOC115415374 n=1 Tax=Sphaeramia orbicularis TaxID=375764 RepID=UPI00117C51F3|nr:uncharacterized protein LOC115415374 [Sphaeramia orbicularis]